MKLSELRQELEWLAEQAGEDNDPEVLLAEQPNWPFEYSVAGVTLVEVDDEGVGLDEPVVFLEEGQQLAAASPADLGSETYRAGRWGN